MLNAPIQTKAKVVNPAKHSVQGRADASTAVMGSDIGGPGGLFLISLGQTADETPAWNALYPNHRDQYLLRFSRTEPMLASAVQSMSMRPATLNYEINGPPRAKKFAQELLKRPGLGDDLIQVMYKFNQDLLTSDNGGFMELWRAGNPATDAGDRPVLGFGHLDSRQCWRSFDPEFPVWYTNPQTGEIRKLHRSRVIMKSVNPQPVEMARNIGFSPVSIILRMARMMRNTLTYRDEKVSGRFTRAIGAVKGVTANQVSAALRATEDDAENKGFVMYKGIPFIIQPNMESSSDIEIVLKDLASIPDGFEFKSDLELYAFMLAFAFGTDAREFWPTTQTGATKADATVQNMKARGKMQSYLIQTGEDVLRQCLPESVTFESDYIDDDQDEQTARIHGLRIDNLGKLKRDGAINELEERALAIAAEIIDGKLLEELNLPATSDDNADLEEADDDALESNTDSDAKPDEALPAAAALKANETGIMAALFLPLDAATALYEQVAPTLVKAGVVPVPPTEYHITLVYAGDVGAYDEGEREELEGGVRKAATKAEPFTASLSGLGRFITDEGGDTHALYVSVDSPYLPGFRQSIFDNLKFHLAIEQNHGFSPHITVAYIPTDMETPTIDLEPVEVDFNEVLLAWGNELIRYPLGKQSKKALFSLKSSSDYRRSLRSLTRGLWTGDFATFDFLDQMYSAITRHFTQAWEEGAKRAGILPGELSEAENARLTLEINTEIAYVLPFAETIVENSKANGGLLTPLLERADGWVSRYERVANIAYTMASADKKLKWKRNPAKDGCYDCLNLDGRVYRGSVWDKNDIQPQSPYLECFGKECGCEFVETDEPITRGRPPALRGRKDVLFDTLLERASVA